jgi:hypothetical protein
MVAGPDQWEQQLQAVVGRPPHTGSDVASSPRPGGRIAEGHATDCRRETPSDARRIVPDPFAFRFVGASRSWHYRSVRRPLVTAVHSGTIEPAHRRHERKSRATIAMSRRVPTSIAPLAVTGRDDTVE